MAWAARAYAQDVMKAIVADRYGSPDVLAFEDRPVPRAGRTDILVEVMATSVTTAEWRMRAGDFGGGMALLGRLLMGITKPRQRTTGREFAGRVVEVGADVTRFSVGDDVFGTTSGANAEVIAVPQGSVVTTMPRGLSYAEAVSLPFGAITALSFLEDRAKVRAGERVLVIGASGGVGVYLVQVARALGAEVTGVCSGANAELVRTLGATHTVDYRTVDIASLPGPFDVVVDTVGKSSFRAFEPMLSPKGRHVFIEGGIRELLQAVTTRFGSGPRVISGVALDDLAGLERVRARVEAGQLRPVIGRRFPMAEVIDAHRLVEARHKQGAVVLDFPGALSAVA